MIEELKKQLSVIEKKDEVSALEQAFYHMGLAFVLLHEVKKGDPSRENSETITLLETAMMWNNKDRTLRGELQPYPTHIG